MLHFEDLIPGRRFHTASHTLTLAEIRDFAGSFDPQFFHLDEVAAEDSVFNGLAASGWHVASLTMRLVVASELSRVAGGLVGMKVDNMRWPRPTRAGDTLQTEIEVLAQRASAKQPQFGIVTLQWTTRNQNEEIAVQLETAIWVKRRDG
ncbi:MaoC family dehydratase [Vogesella indigofera]|uniref:MaoC family dehydratase n=1 Tax=Vogesella indigofera TaxID=45465 RepID=UPI00234EEA82|nr:MaoC family dehydratase [Vogesella indigofera]MDC7711920.1 MaoC family dehydratase [Vogesella indigofera]